MMRVWHRIEPTWRESFEIAEWPTGYRHVATVEGSALEEAFRLTNHVSKPWWEHAGVEGHVIPSRSTSVGDIIEWECKFYGVGSIGFVELGS